MPLRQGFTTQALGVLQRAAMEAEGGQIRGEHILIALCHTENTTAAQLMQLCGVDTGQVLICALGVTLPGKMEQARIKREGSNTKLLEQFSEDLVAKAVNLDPVIGRDREINMVISILSRKNKNNPALIGDPGVGKTAIAEGLAQRMAVGNVPPQLKDKRLVSLNMANLVAGTKYRGEFEDKKDRKALCAFVKLQKS